MHGGGQEDNQWEKEQLPEKMRICGMWLANKQI